MPLDLNSSALGQIQPMVAEHSSAAWSRALEGLTPETAGQRELATLLLAVNYELLGYPPEHAWLLARRGESGAPRHLDG